MMMFSWMREAAARNRSSPRLTTIAHMVAGVLFALALLDVFSTNLGLAAGAVEANRFIRWLQVQFGVWWFVPKLFFHMVPIVMILWYPHRWVLAIVAPVVPLTAYFVWNNMLLARM